MTIGSKMQVWLSRSESRDWADEEFRADLLERLRRATRAKGRRYYEVYDAAGAQVHAGEA